MATHALAAPTATAKGIRPGASIALSSAMDAPGLMPLAVAVGAASAWVAIRDWPHRAHCLIGAGVPVATILIARRTAPEFSLAALVFVTSAALTLQGVCDD